MIKNNESFDKLINYFDSEQYKQLLKGFISVSETAESLLDKFSFNILDSMTSALINISKSFEQRQSKILFDSLEILKNVPLDSLDWNSSSNREVQLDDKSVERVSDVLDTVIPDDVPKKKSLEETLKKHQATTAFIFGLLMLLLEIYSVFFTSSDNQSENVHQVNEVTISIDNNCEEHKGALSEIQKDLLLSIQDLTQILENNGLPVNDIDDEITKTAESDRQHENGDCETGNQDAQNES